VSGEKLKILIAKPGLDGHDVGAKVVVRALMDAGFEVFYTGLRKTPEEIVKIAIEKEVDVLGLSILSGSHMSVCESIRDLMPELGLKVKAWIVGGNVPHKDIDALKALGVSGVFPFGTNFEAMINFINEEVS
jgi:methylmalonyl-CoA mutase C-terminal domain/subunit